MRNQVLAAVFVLGLGSPVWAQDFMLFDPATLPIAAESEPAEPEAFKAGGLGFGVRAGYLVAKDADDGTWFGGIQVRFPLGDMFAIEGSIDVHASDYEDGEIEVVQYPLQVSLLWFILPKGSVCPYLLGGFGWWYTTVDFSGSLDGLDGETDSMIGVHLGGGVRFGPFNADLRYHFLEPNEDALEDEEFDTFQIVLSYMFGF